MPFPASMADASRGMRGTQGQSRGPFGGTVSTEGTGGFTTLPKPTMATPPAPTPTSTPPQFGPTQVRPQNSGMRPQARMAAIMQMLQGRRF